MNGLIIEIKSTFVAINKKLMDTNRVVIINSIESIEMIERIGVIIKTVVRFIQSQYHWRRHSPNSLIT